MSKLFEKITLREYYRKQAYKAAADFIDELIQSKYPPEVKTGTLKFYEDVTFEAPLIVYGSVEIGKKLRKGKQSKMTLYKIMTIFAKERLKGEPNE